MKNIKNMTKGILVGAIILGSLGFSSNLKADTLLSEKEIEKIVLKDNPNGQITKLELDRDDGQLIYEVEVRDGRIEKEYEIEARNGTILKVQTETKKFAYNNSKADLNNVKLSIEDAKQIAIKNSDNATVKNVQLKSYRGRAVYDIDVKKGHRGKDFLIDANTGEILRVGNY